MRINKSRHKANPHYILIASFVMSTVYTETETKRKTLKWLDDVPHITYPFDLPIKNIKFHSIMAFDNVCRN